MQQFRKGDWVRINKDLGPGMRHFTSDCEAIVIGSYADQYGGGNHEQYTLYLQGSGECSWYYGDQLTLIETGRSDKLQSWADEAELEWQQKSNLEWIFSHGEDVLKKPHGASIQALATCFGLTNLWGASGEGMTYYNNAICTMQLAAPYLKAGDKDGWMMRCDEIRANAALVREQRRPA